MEDALPRDSVVLATDQWGRIVAGVPVWPNNICIDVFIYFQVKGFSPLKQSHRERSILRSPTAKTQTNPLSRKLFSIFGGKKQATSFNEEGAKKANPKIFFSNERTFLKWMNVSVWVAGISLGLSTIEGASSGGLESLSSLFFSAIAIVIVCYSMVQCKLIKKCTDGGTHRATTLVIAQRSSGTKLCWKLNNSFLLFLKCFEMFVIILTFIADAKRSLLIVKRSPGPYEDRWGPIVIGSLFVVSFTAQYCITMASLPFHK